MLDPPACVDYMLVAKKGDGSIDGIVRFGERKRQNEATRLMGLVNAHWDIAKDLDGTIKKIVKSCKDGDYTWSLEMGDRPVKGETRVELDQTQARIPQLTTQVESWAFPRELMDFRNPAE